MQSIIVTSHPLEAHPLHEALKRLNIDSICTRPRALQGWQPDTDAVIFQSQISPHDFDLLSDFVDELSSEVPLIFLHPFSEKFSQTFPSLVERSVLVGNELDLEDTAHLIYDLISEIFDEQIENIVSGPITLNRHMRHLEILGKTVNLTKKEFCLMELLTRNLGKIISRERIIDHVWDRRTYVASNTIDVYVSRLRKKLPKDSHGPIIKTIPCLGYSLHLAPI